MNNRELIFRAWHREREEMYWFDLMWGQTSRSGSGWIGMLPIGEEIKYDVFCPDNRILINPDECDIMQFTGLLDKEGNRIFEGDIIRTMSGIAVVVWLDAAFALKSPGSEAVDWVYSSVYEQSEILGNIHQTPELLNQQQ